MEKGILLQLFCVFWRLCMPQQFPLFLPFFLFSSFKVILLLLLEGFGNFPEKIL